jgi:hypothetical protein
MRLTGPESCWDGLCYSWAAAVGPDNSEPPPRRPILCRSALIAQANGRRRSPLSNGRSLPLTDHSFTVLVLLIRRRVAPFLALVCFNRMSSVLLCHDSEDGCRIVIESFR